MLYRIAFIGIAAFWVTMNVLLWRSEYAPQGNIGSEVSVPTIWLKILTAPDNSPLEVRQHGKYLGFVRWSPEVVAQKSAAKNPAADASVEDMVSHPANYKISLEGNVALPGISNRLRVDLDAVLATNHEWREFTLQLGLRPNNWEFHSIAVEKTMHFKMEGGADAFTQDFKFSELQNPVALLREFGGPLPLALLAGAGLPPEATPSTKPMSLGLAWQAHESWLKLGHSTMRVYRLETKLLDRYQVVVTVSRAGEILKVELPGGVALINEQLATA